MKKYIFLAASALALASCQSDDFLGNTPGNTPSSANSAIKFDGNAGKISRATSNSGTPQQMLDYQFKIYGVKSGENGKYSKVFEDYSIWWDTKKTTSNTNDWEYVAGAGEISTGETENPTKITLNKAQTIKYWDYASNNYHFVAGSPISAFTYKLDETTKDIESATVIGLGGHIYANPKTGTDYASDPSPVYIAEPVIVEQAKYKEAVKFNFVRQQTKVRVGIYETIPGYSISNIKFYSYEENSDAFSTTTSDNIVLTTTTAKYFSGGDQVSGKIKYDWSKATPEYTFEYVTTGLKESKNWYGGKFESGVPATALTENTIKKLYGTDGDMHANGYFTVLPTPSAMDPKPILIKCDYTLTADDKSGETINVKGATAAIPAAYSKWYTNTLYTYIFKISENTNGYTGDDPDHTGLYPITFDAAVKEPEFGTLGTITTFTAPSITTHQDGSVTDKGIEYKTGTKITVSVTDEKGNVLTLSTDETAVGHIAVYKFDEKITEAEVQVKSTDGGTKVSGSTDNDNVYTFTPTEAGWYAIQYLAKAKEGETPAVYTYKVVHVEAAN